MEKGFIESPLSFTGGASAIHALGQQLLSQMALLSKESDDNMKAISSNLDTPES